MSLAVPSRRILLEGRAVDRSRGLGMLGLARSRRVDLVMLGDSNQLKDGHGWDHGLGRALAARFGLYASPLYGAVTSTADGYSYQGFANTNIGPAVGAYSGAASEFDAFKLAGRQYTYQASGDIGSSNGVSASPDALGLNVNALLTSWFAYGTWPSGGGSFRPGWRREDSPFTGIAAGSVVDVNTGAYGVGIASLNMNAATRNYPVSAKWRLPGGTALVGPMIEFWQRIEQPDRAVGISAHTLNGVSGWSAYDMAAWAQAQTQQSIINFFSAIRYLQTQAGQEPKVVVRLNFGMNDRNETSQPSLGPNPSSDADGADAYSDNLEAIIVVIEDAWTAAGWPLSGLAWLVTPSHPVSAPDDAELVAYRDAARALAARRPRVSVFDIEHAISATEIAANGWYQSGGADTAHLTQAGYEAIGALEAAAVP